LYYLLSGCNRDARFSSVARAEWAQLDGLTTEGLKAVFRYTDAATDDAALTAAVMRSAEMLGAELQCRAEFINGELTSDGVRVDYRLPKAECSCTAKVLINAAGPWVNKVLSRVSPQQKQISVELVQGTHIEVPGTMGEDFYYVESPRDGRAVFVMPRNGRIMIGTTETRYRSDPDFVKPLANEESYLLNVAGHYFPQLASLRRDDMVASWAGLRVLPGGEGHAFHRSRETILHTDRARQPRVLSIYGGKLTSYRATAQKIAEQISGSLPQRHPVARTQELPLTPYDYDGL